MPALPSVPCIFALLRVLRDVPRKMPEDEDLLFDEFGVVGDEAVISRACRRFLAEGVGPHNRVRRIAALDALLVDMLGEYQRQRKMKEAA